MQDSSFSPFEDIRSETASIHESAYIDAPCQIGSYTEVLHFSHIMGHSVIGDYCLIGHHVTIAVGVLIGNHVRIMDHVLLNSGVILEDEVRCGPCVVFSPLKHIRAENRPVSRVIPTLVRRGAHLGPNTTIASGLTIGRYAFIEAGSVVDGNIPDFALACGNPLKLIGWRCQCGESLKFSEEMVRCASCGAGYERKAARKVVLLTDPTSIPPQIRTQESFFDFDSHSGFNPSI